ncbi:MAG: aspartate carbamoyltransferase [Candidatus Sungbacteria bacterium]|nr:aspartate carbamoyltransferase [Candidatus Sungbacteria bacterium]
MRHILTSEQFDRPFLEWLFQQTDSLRTAFAKQQLGRPLDWSMLFTIFYEPSTRTRISFEAGASHLGMRVVSTENAREFSSGAKGETLEDTIRILCGYKPSVIVLRHFENGAAERAAKVSTVPIINAGDGPGEHPTQALLDLYTIAREKGKIDGLTIVIGGDLAHGRTARSLAKLLAKFDDVQIIFVAPPRFRIGRDIKDYLKRHHAHFSEEIYMFPALAKADVIYWTRIQSERMMTWMPKFMRRWIAMLMQQPYIIGRTELERIREDAIVLHPLPRVGEITTEVDIDLRAAYFRQAENGMYVRMVLLDWVLQ